MTDVMTLEEILKHLHELSEKGLFETEEFNQGLDSYIHILAGANNLTEIRKAISFLSSIDSIGTLNLEFLIEQLEEKI